MRLAAALWLSAAACAEPVVAVVPQPAAQEPAPVDKPVDKPKQVAPVVTELLRLPKVLREVSGIAAIDAESLLCVQDEVGALFTVSLVGAAVRSESFGAKGDYEALALVGSTPWVLRSDGVLLELVRVSEGWEVARTVQLPKRFTDWEGLCRDEAGARLLVMPKDRVTDDKEQRDQRPVFAVDPVRGELLPEPVLVLRRKELIAAAAAGGHALPTRTTDKGRERVELELACSELCVVPGKRELLVLSAVDHLLLRVDFEGRLLAVRLLDPELLPQPEGMTFLPDGRLVVASEGAGGRARLAVVTVP
jgi:uncharacterized protein YjiK